jgi:hypothetical protein
MKKSDLISNYTDYNSIYLNKLREYYSQRQDKYKIFSLTKGEKFNYDYLKKERYFYEVSNKIEAIDFILPKREEKYIVPIA